MNITNSNRVKILIFFIGINVFFMIAYMIYYKLQNPSLVVQNKNITQDEMTKADIENIITRYMKKIKQDPNDIEALKSLASIFMQMRAWDRAEFFLKRVYKILPEDEEIILNLAMCDLFLKKYNEGAKLLEKIIEIDPKNYMAKFNLAYLYGFILNKKKRSQILFKELINNKDVPKNIKDKANESLNELNKN